MTTTAEASTPASVSAAPEPSPASSAGPATNIPVPAKPALADENSAEGLEAFTEYWLELFSYGYETNDWAPFDEVTDPRCGTCSTVSSAVRNVYESGGWVSGGDSRVMSFVSDFQINTQGSIGSYVEVVQGESRIYSASGNVVEETPEGTAKFKATFSAYLDGRWVMLDFGAPEGTE
ncbi:hypothetical protein IWX63_000117 [Arthrobacter sp. CAN_A2]|uniref:DUF6318 family protein n=1 Tax=Arthrobacter sp. CAN_A2 TaxID=2787718 RepID=UPI0018EFF408